MENNQARRCVIVGGATIERYDVIRAYLRDTDFYIFCKWYSCKDKDARTR